jgi:uncharacterized membrane protein YeaQ/YmgE (transglycosylase-associated protein family)
MGLHGSPWQGAEINIYIWCAVGAVLGALAGAMMADKLKLTLIENVLVGVFGAAIGGELGGPLLAGSKDGQFTVAGLMMAIAGAVVILLLLKVMRGAVGPMRVSKGRPERRY